MSPRITVLMPVYNAASYVAEAANSILSDEFRDIELLAINDGSSDNSEEVLRSLNDSRVRVVNNPSNMGVVATLNKGLDLAQGEFVVRMDADDISMSNRLARQLAFMEENPHVGVSGTSLTVFGAAKKHTVRMQLDSTDIDVGLFAYNRMAHPTVILRMSLLNKHSLRFSQDAAHAEDLDLWMRATECFPLANIPLIGLRYRVHPNQVTQKHSSAQALTTEMLRTKQLLRLMPNASEVDIAMHLALFDVNKEISIDFLVSASAWLEALEAANANVKRYDARVFRAFLVERWLNAAHRCIPASFQVWKTWRQSEYASVGIGKQLRLLLKKTLQR